MRITVRWVSFLVFGMAAAALGHADLAYSTISWKEEIAHGYLPYHRLVGTDFPVDDAAHPANGMYTAGFFHYDYQCRCVPQKGGVTASVTKWVVRSGFDRNKSSRKSWFQPVEKFVVHEQGHLDINELRSRALANIKVTQLPTGSGINFQSAIADLDRKLKELADRTSSEAQVEQDSYDLETNRGRNAAGQASATAAIHERLKAAGIKDHN
jgi:hypothetical protein